MGQESESVDWNWKYGSTRDPEEHSKHHVELYRAVHNLKADVENLKLVQTNQIQEFFDEVDAVRRSVAEIPDLKSLILSQGYHLAHQQREIDHLRRALRKLEHKQPLEPVFLAVFPLQRIQTMPNTITYALIAAVSFIEADGSTGFYGLQPQTIAAQPATDTTPAFPAVTIKPFDDQHPQPANFPAGVEFTTEGDGTYTPPATADGTAGTLVVIAGDQIKDVVIATDAADNLTGEFDFQAPPIIPLVASGLQVFPLPPTTTTTP